MTAAAVTCCKGIGIPVRMKGGLSCSDLQSGAVVAPTAEDMRGGKARHVGIIAGGGRIADAARRLSRGDSMAAANGLSSLSTTAMERIYACRPSSRWLQHREVMQVRERTLNHYQDGFI